MRWGLVVCAALLLAHVPEAAARDCKQTQRVLPADGATGVPLNAKVWLFGKGQGAYVLIDGATQRPLGSSYWNAPDIMKLDLGHLDALHTYTVQTYRGEHVTTFTTGTEVDTTPPDRPTLTRVSFEGRLLVAAVPSTQSVAVWVTVRRPSDQKQRSWQIFPAEAFDTAFDTCNVFDKYAPDSACAEVTAVDLAYNQSRIVSNCYPVVGVHYLLPQRKPRRDATAKLITIVFGVLAGFAMIALARLATRLHA